MCASSALNWTQSSSLEPMYCGGTAYFGVDNEHEENWCFFYNRFYSEHWNNAGDMIQVRNNARIAYQGFKHFWVTGDKDD